MHLMTQYVNAVSYLYEKTDFDGNGTPESESSLILSKWFIIWFFDLLFHNDHMFLSERIACYFYEIFFQYILGNVFDKAKLLQ